MKLWNRKNHELSWTFEVLNFHELSRTFMKLCSLKVITLQWSTREFSKIMKSQSFVWVSTMRGGEGEFGHGLFLLTESPKWQCFAPWKNMTAKSWKTNFKMDALLESKVATRWSVVNHENWTVRTFHNAWRRKGVWVAGSQAVTAATVLCTKIWSFAASKNSGGEAKRVRPHELSLKSRRSGSCGSLH